MIDPKAAAGELTRKYYGPDARTQSKSMKTGNVPAPSIKSFIEIDGHLVDEEIAEELTATIKATSQVLAAARQLMEV